MTSEMMWAAACDWKRMRNKDAFSGYHPAINFLYFALVLLFSMCLMHPVYLAISLTGALAYDVYLKGKSGALRRHGVTFPWR